MTTRCTLYFEPLDVLQFRDHRPFDAGYDVVAESIFPMPSVFYGCVRTALFRACRADFHARDDFFGLPEGDWAREVLGGRRSQGSLALRGPLLARRDEREVLPLFGLPRDLVLEGGEERATGFILTMQSFEGEDAPRRLRCGPESTRRAGGPLPWTSRQISKKQAAILLTPGGARAYFAASGDLDLRMGEDAVARDSVFQTETRLGIARKADTHTVEEGMLYIKRPYRLGAGYGFAVDVATGDDRALPAVQALEGAVVPLGGKGHRARIRVSEGPLIPADLDPATMDEAAEGAKLWLLSPLTLPLGAGAELVTSRGAPIGGYDLAARAPKPLRRALPAGTVIGMGPTGSVRGALDGLFASRGADRRMGYGTALGSVRSRSKA